MNKKTLQFNSLMDVYKAIEKDIITPNKGVKIICIALNMIDVRFSGDCLYKNDVLVQIKKLEEIIREYGDVPIFFGQTSIDFSINELNKGVNKL